jgi:hypothetical protein
MSKSVREVAELLGCSQEYVKAAYHAKDLPGYVLSMDGEHFRYLMTDEAFERLSSGDWRPQPKRVLLVEHRERCPRCGGMGRVPNGWDNDDAPFMECEACEGRGVIGVTNEEEAA